MLVVHVSINSETCEIFDGIGAVASMNLISIYLAGVFFGLFLFLIACAVVSTSFFLNYLVLLKSIQNFIGNMLNV